MAYKIFFSNIGYAKGIDGTLWQHICRIHRHLYCGLPLQQQVLSQLKAIIMAEQPDLCCLVEIDRGSFHSSYYNQMLALLDEEYHFHDIADKYGEGNQIGRMPFFQGKSNAFLARTPLPYERLYFKYGAKRLIYRIQLPGNVFLFFAHFSLQARVRAQQFDEVRRLIEASPGEAIILADFNIMQGFDELKGLLGSDLVLLNGEKDYTFTLHRSRWVLDLCICSRALAPRLRLEIIQQPFSDHAALLVEGNWE